MTARWFPLMPPDAERGHALTLEEWLARGEDDPGEWVDGRLKEEEVPDPIHELAAGWLLTLITNWLKGRDGFVFGSEVKLIVAEGRGRKSDLSVYLPGGSRPPKRGALVSPPDIVVEVVTPTPRDERRDRVEKMAEYEAFGVRWYWLLDPALGSLEIFERGADGRYAKWVGATGGIIEAPGCQGLIVNLDELWAELDRLS